MVLIDHITLPLLKCGYIKTQIIMIEMIIEILTYIGLLKSSKKKNENNKKV